MAARTTKQALISELRRLKHEDHPLLVLYIGENDKRLIGLTMHLRALIDSEKLARYTKSDLMKLVELLNRPPLLIEEVYALLGHDAPRVEGFPVNEGQQIYNALQILGFDAPDAELAEMADCDDATVARYINCMEQLGLKPPA